VSGKKRRPKHTMHTFKKNKKGKPFMASRRGGGGYLVEVSEKTQLSAAKTKIKKGGGWRKKEVV